MVRDARSSIAFLFAVSLALYVPICRCTASVALERLLSSSPMINITQCPPYPPLLALDTPCLSDLKLRIQSNGLRLSPNDGVPLQASDQIIQMYTRMLKLEVKSQSSLKGHTICERRGCCL